MFRATVPNSDATDATGAAWDAVATTDPYIGSLGDPRYAGLNLSKSEREAFFSTGRGDVAHVLRLFAQHYSPPQRFDHALDFGCGVGRWLLPMADHAEAVSGVDVSRAMLRKAKRHVRGALLSSDIPAGPHDWINSFLTFPHILPARGLALLDALLASAAEDCALSLHLAISTASPPPEAGGPSAFFASDLPSWLDRLYRAGFASVATEYLDFGAYQGVRLISARGAYREE